MPSSAQSSSIGWMAEVGLVICRLAGIVMISVDYIAPLSFTVR